MHTPRHSFLENVGPIVYQTFPYSLTNNLQKMDFNVYSQHLRICMDHSCLQSTLHCPFFVPFSWALFGWREKLTNFGCKMLTWSLYQSLQSHSNLINLLHDTFSKFRVFVYYKKKQLFGPIVTNEERLFD